MVGGRQPPRPGAITRAHLGTLLLDEVLLFRPEVQEALREPLETGFVHLARGPDARKFPADFQLLGTTNLCECGMWTPNAEAACRCPSRIRARFDSRLRGPFVDRFQLLVYTNGWKPAQGKVSMTAMSERVLKAREFQIAEGRESGNRRWRPVGSEKVFSKLPKNGSERRRLAIQRVARTLADLELRKEITSDDLFIARGWALETFDQLLQQSAAAMTH
jgi:magnesium chelatase family protein